MGGKGFIPLLFQCKIIEKLEKERKREKRKRQTREGRNDPDGVKAVMKR